MSIDSPSIMLDTNIWMDYYLDNRSGHKDALRLIEYTEDHRITLIYAATSAKDLFYLLNASMKDSRRMQSKKTGRDRMRPAGNRGRQGKGEASFALSEEEAIACRDLAWACIDHMTSLAVASPIGEGEIWKARHQRVLCQDFEDDLIIASLMTSKADFFVTGDKSLAAKVPVGAYDAAAMLAFLESNS